MNDFDPQLKSSIDDIWLNKARQEVRQSIRKNLELIAEGHFSEDELMFALSTDEMPYVDYEEDKVLDDIFDSGDIKAWNDYMQLHPEIVDREDAKRKIFLAQEAARDRQSINEYPDLSLDDAIEAVVASREEEIKWSAKFRQAAMEAAAQNGFPI